MPVSAGRTYRRGGTPRTRNATLFRASTCRCVLFPPGRGKCGLRNCSLLMSSRVESGRQRTYADTDTDTVSNSQHAASRAAHAENVGAEA